MFFQLLLLRRQLQTRGQMWQSQSEQMQYHQYSCTSCREGWIDDPTASGTQGMKCLDHGESALGEDDCNRATQFCLNCRPSQKWECVIITPAPTVPLTASPTNPQTQPPPPTPAPTCWAITSIFTNHSECCRDNCYVWLLTSRLCREVNVTLLVFLSL
jgi:hypothetical protein